MAPVAGGEAVQLAADQFEPTRTAVDDIAVYWTNAGSGAVMMVVK